MAGAEEDDEDVAAEALACDGSGEVGPFLKGDVGQHGRGQRRLLLVTASSSSLRLYIYIYIYVGPTLLPPIHCEILNNNYLLLVQPYLLLGKETLLMP
jgi:hypothetical protein